MYFSILLGLLAYFVHSSSESQHNGELTQKNIGKRHADALDNAVGKQFEASHHLSRINSTVLVHLLRRNAQKSFFKTKERIYYQMVAAKEKAEAVLHDANEASETAKSKADRLKAFNAYMLNYESRLKSDQLVQEAASDPQYQNIDSEVNITSNIVTDKKRVLAVRSRNEIGAKTAMESAKAQLDLAEVALNKVCVSKEDMYPKSDRDIAIIEFENAICDTQKLTGEGAIESIVQDPVIDLIDTTEGSGEVDGSGEEAETPITI
ncbi:hypothetical protein Ddc_18356 [Ditylenchus destructor]|nr:hypothetical protein Ddc_18356 [Ditylenchus destructor]